MIIDLFPTSVYVDEFSLTDTERDFLLSVPLNRNDDDVASVSSTRLNEEEGYQSFLRKVDQHVYEYAFNIMKLDPQYGLKCHCAWVNRNDTGDRTNPHHHSNSLISGVYYIDVEAESQGAIDFTDEKCGPFGKFFTLLKYTEQEIRNSHISQIKVKNGMILLFPSILKHGVAMNRSLTPRYTTAFDYMIEGQVSGWVNRMDVTL